MWKMENFPLIIPSTPSYMEHCLGYVRQQSDIGFAFHGFGCLNFDQVV